MLSGLWNKGGARGLHTPGAREHRPCSTSNPANSIEIGCPASGVQSGSVAVSAGAWGMKPEETAPQPPERSSNPTADEKGRGLVRTAPEAFRP